MLLDSHKMLFGVVVVAFTGTAVEFLVGVYFVKHLKSKRDLRKMLQLTSCQTLIFLYRILPFLYTYTFILRLEIFFVSHCRYNVKLKHKLLLCSNDKSCVAFLYSCF